MRALGMQPLNKQGSHYTANTGIINYAGYKQVVSTTHS